MPQRIQGLLNSAANGIYEYSHTLTSKLLAVVGGASAVTHTSIGESIGLLDWVVSFPWLNLLSYIAVILLIIERSFIVWSHYRKYKREKNKLPG